MEIVPGASGAPGEPAGTVYYLVRKVAAVTGHDLRNARPSLDENNQPAVHFELKSAGAQRFGKLSGENIGRYLAIVLDNRVVSAPRQSAASPARTAWDTMGRRACFAIIQCSCCRPFGHVGGTPSLRQALMLEEISPI